MPLVKCDTCRLAPLAGCPANIKQQDEGRDWPLRHVVIDCPDPLRLATFYSELLGSEITYRSDNWIVVSTSTQASGLAFQLAPDHRPPRWPDPENPQQFHRDVMVKDVAAAGSRVLALGATKLPGSDVYADPAGHPFCLIRRPAWAESIT